MKTLILSSLICVAGLTASVDRETVWRELESRLNEARSLQAETTAAIDAEKVSLLRELEDAESALLATQRQWELVRAKEHSLEDASLREPMVRRIELIQNAIGELEQFGGEFSGHLHPAEAVLSKKLRDVLLPSWEVTSEGLTSDAGMESHIEVVGTAIVRLENLSGGTFFHSEGLYPDGSWSNGEVLLLGPLAFFKPEDAKNIGWINSRSSGIPALSDQFPASQEELGSVFERGVGVLSIPADPMHPYLLESGASGIFSTIAKGGIWIFPIIAFAFLALGSALLKWWRLRAYSPPPMEQFESMIQNLNLLSGEELASRLDSFTVPLRRLVGKGLDMKEQSARELEVSLLKEVYPLHPEMTRLLPFIAITASVSPLLGLLGTVSGMIETFDIISVHGVRNAQMLSGGISEALITTEFGLIVAIPALVLHTLLSRRVKWLMVQYERMARLLALSLTRKAG